MEKTINVGSVLSDTKVTVKPIRRLSDWLPEGHDSNFMNEGARWTIGVPMLRDKKALVDPLKDLSPDEKQDLADKLGLESPSQFNIYRPENFWKTFSVNIDRNGLQLDLNDPYDYITYRVLQCNTEWIAPSLTMRNMKQTYKFALEHDNEKLVGEVSMVNKKESSYLALSKMSNSQEMMSNFMWAHYLQVKTAQRPPMEAPSDWLKKEIGKIIEHDPSLFLSIAEDETYPYKVLIMKALNIGALSRSGDNTYKFPGATKAIGSLEQMVAHIRDERHQEDLLKLKTQIDIAQKETLTEKVSDVSLEVLKEFAVTGKDQLTDSAGDSGIILPEDVKKVQHPKSDSTGVGPKTDK